MKMEVDAKTLTLMFAQLIICTSRANTIKARVIRVGPGCNRDEAKRFVAYGCLILFELPSR